VRPRRSTLLWLALFGLLVVIGTNGSGLIGRTEDDRLDASVGGRVVRVIDGDTIRVHLDDPAESRTVRYIGVDTPETVKPGEPVQCFGKVASHFNHRLVAGRRVQLVLGRERRDRYGRLLAYVRVEGGPLVEDELLRRGYARTLTIPPNNDRARHFASLERRARGAGIGLWGACPPGGG
jgi:endonuclease YncB( thermonuclease family)